MQRHPRKCTIHRHRILGVARHFRSVSDVGSPLVHSPHHQSNTLLPSLRHWCPPKRATFLIGNEDSDDEEDERSLTQTPGRDISSSPPPVSPPVSPRSANSVLPLDEYEEQRRRRWTLMTDEAISDNDFAETVLSCNQCTSLDGHLYDEYPYDDLGLLHSPSLSNVDSVRRSTLLALLTTRDILRTERHYHTQMLILLHQTRTHNQWPVHPPPTVMLQRLLVLISTSERLLTFMEDDPSVNGIASALIHLEYEVSNALGDWCSIVGGWFDDDRRRKLSRHSRTLSAKFNWSPVPPVPPLPPLPAPRAVSEPVTPLLSPDSRKKMWRMSLPVLPTLIQSSPQSRPKHTIQDLGILPVQRVTRYVLFFKDLLKHTDSESPSHHLVQRAVAAAMRIAQRCNDAQGNAKFLRV
ncbi:hypothetical protein CYLTODRAFT_220037 [Cylindrobasidium torrendii FP15055 ss-10]|uniref:DH domain-containing protein n=1 Tax=Cylindrobasidium torrendii FP15055 ss-10 TaxID=1314674 RepID=A0A0D7BTT4_9AGAR|nr:hypothetical protein CYLTODRAFT_220037 [Cylindrobasidium torrendii FP15055 ss-10]